MKTAIHQITIGRIAIGFLCAGGLATAWAQDGLRGHWSGSLELPNQNMAMEVDLDKGANGWIGAISIPAQTISGMPLDGITFANGKCVFHIKNAPGDPTFTGTLAADGKTMSGDFTQGGGSFPFKFSRSGDPKIEQTKPSPALEKQFVGNWEGTLEGPGLRLVFHISNEGNNSKAVIVSLDQGGVEIPASAIEQKGSKLTIIAQAIGGKYEGEINKEGAELKGTWSQGGGEMPLTLKKAVEKKP